MLVNPRVQNLKRIPQRRHVARQSSWLMLAAWCAGALISCLTGCAQWNDEIPDEAYTLPAQRMSADTVVLEVMSIEVPADSLEAYEELWNHLDNTSFPIESRRYWQSNGLRCGIASTRLPAKIEDLLERQEIVNEVRAETGGEIYTNEGWGSRWQARMGHPKHFALTETLPTMAWIMDSDGYLKGRSVQDAQCQAEIVSFPQPDGKVRIDVLPLIEHGQPKQRIDVSQQAFAFKVERDREKFQDLKINAEMIAGQTLVISQTPENAGLGHVFFGGGSENSGGKKILLIRVAQTQLDELFAREQIFAPIETPTE